MNCEIIHTGICSLKYFFTVITIKRCRSGASERFIVIQRQVSYIKIKQQLYTRNIKFEKDKQMTIHVDYGLHHCNNEIWLLTVCVQKWQ
jgi:hypothetical protein